MPTKFIRIARSIVLLLTVGSTLAVLCGGSNPAQAQRRGSHPRGNAELSGVVLGPNDKPVPNAAITYQSSSGSAPHFTRANSQGRFSITGLAKDNYDIRASAKGLFSEWEKNVVVRSGRTTSITLRLIYSKAPLKNNRRQ